MGFCLVVGVAGCGFAGEGLLVGVVAPGGSGARADEADALAGAGAAVAASGAAELVGAGAASGARALLSGACAGADGDIGCSRGTLRSRLTIIVTAAPATSVAARIVARRHDDRGVLRATSIPCVLS